MAKLKTSGILVILSIVIIIFIFWGYFAIQKKEKSIITNAIEAIPIDAAYILEIPNAKKFIKSINEDSTLNTQFANIQQLSNLKNQLFFIDSLIEFSETTKNILKKQKVIISAHTVGTSNKSFLIAFKIPNKQQQKQIISDIYKFVNITDTSYRNYNNYNIYNINTDSNSFYFSIIDNIFILSKSQLLIETAIRHKLSNNPISIELGFKETSKALSKNKVHIIVNYNNSSSYFYNFFNHNFGKKIKNIKTFANWLAADVEITENSININGNTYTEPSSDMFLYMFNNCKPQKFKEAKLLPYKTAEFIDYQIDNFPKFYSAYEKYIGSKNLSGNYSDQINSFNSKHKIDIQSEVITLIGNSIIFSKVKFNNTLENFSNFAIIKLKNRQDFNAILTNITKKYVSEDSLQIKYSELYRIDNSNTVRIFELPVDNFLNLFLGELYNISSMNYYLYIDNYIIFGSSYKNLEKYYYSYFTAKTLAYNEDFKKFANTIPESSNILYFTNNNFNANNQINALNSSLSSIYKKNLNLFNKFQFTTIQYIFDKNLLFQTHINSFYNPKLENNGVTVWETKLRSNVSKKPVFFINHNTFEREVLIADDSNYVYLIDNHGKILWIKHIKEQIIDNYQIVDFYNNNKYQIMLATTNNIITFDRNGKVLNNKCLKLPAATGKGVTVVDYDGNKNYRFFVPCTNNKIYLYDINLKPIDGWIIPETQTNIVSKIYYFNYEGKDYIVFGDKTKPYILNRKGEERIKVKQNVALPNNCSFYFQEKTNTHKAGFITSDASGKIIFIDLLGNVSAINLGTFSINHQLLAYDLNNDKNLDFIITDDKTIFVYNSDGNKIFSHTFSEKILQKPFVLKFSDNDIQIGISIPNENKIYIFKSNGTIRNNFPLIGNSLFSVGHLSSKDNFSVIVGQNNILYNYLLY